VLAARIGSHRTVVLTLLALITGQLIRSLVPGTTALFAGSLIALAGIAVGNVGRRWPPRRGRRSPSASAT
jgi:CP family cyanate transporter-like MFS transporter